MMACPSRPLVKIAEGDYADLAGAGPSAVGKTGVTEVFWPDMSEDEKRSLEHSLGGPMRMNLYRSIPAAIGITPACARSRSLLQL
jgi:hypothetical protein